MADSAKAKHILISWAGLQSAGPEITRTKEEAKKLADSILNVVNANSAKFEALAEQYSADTSNKDKGGDLGYFSPGMMVPPFNDFVFENTSGTTGVVETNFGYHVISIEDQKNMQKAIKVATISKEIETSEETMNTVFSNATKFEVAVADGDFATVAKEQNVALKPVKNIGEMEANIAGIGENRTIIGWAFNKDETNIGDSKRFSVPNGYVIAQLTRRNDEGLMSVAQATPIVKPILIKGKKAEKIRASITGATLQEIAKSQGVAVQNATDITMAAPLIPGAGNEPKVTGTAFGTKAGETTELIDGETGVFKVRVLAVNKAPKLANYASYASQLNAKTLPTVNTNVYKALKEAGEIEDNRAVFY